jgi:hypothetical protein
VYYSDNPAEFLDRIAGLLRAPDWRNFDNTAFGQARHDALDLLRRMQAGTHS